MNNYSIAKREREKHNPKTTRQRTFRWGWRGLGFRGRQQGKELLVGGGGV
jgi:hypothetical protein